MQARGPLEFWQHTHRFTAVSPHKTEVHEHIDYRHKPGVAGLLTRILFNKPSLWGLFTARKLLTRYHVGRQLAGAKESSKVASGK